MRTWMFHQRCPEGKIFDTTGETAPVPPSEPGWVDTPAKLVLDVAKATEQMIENAVKAELAAQGSHRRELELEHKKKYGEEPSYRATNEEVANVMDNKTADGQGKVNPKFFSKRSR
jgi:hypothetical protein